MSPFISLLLKERIALLKRGGLLNLLVRSLGVLTIGLLVAPSGLGLAMLASRTPDKALYSALVGATAVAMFGFWLIGGIVFMAPLTLRIEVQAARALPISFRSLYAVGLLWGLGGLWLLYLAPPLVWFALHRGPLAFLAIACFAIVCGRLVSITTGTTVSLTHGWRRPVLLVLVFTLGTFLLFALLYHRVHLDAATLVRWDLLQRLRFTPPGALARALTGRSWESLGVLLLWLGILVFVDYRVQRHRLFGAGSAQGIHGSSSRALRLATRCGSGPALLVREGVLLLRLRPFRMVTLFGVAYFAVYPLMMPREEVTVVFAALLAAMPFIFLHPAAGNLLGIDCRSARNLALPVGGPELVQAKGWAVITLALALDGEFLATLALTGKFPGSPGFLLAFVLGLGATVLGSGTLFSTLMPHPVDLRRQYSVGNDAGSTLTFLSIGLWIGASVLLARFSWRTPAEWTLALAACAVHRYVSVPLISRSFEHRREWILDRLTRLGSTVS